MVDIVNFRFRVHQFYQVLDDGDDIFFGLVSGLAVELGYFSLDELKSVKGPLGLPIERDLHFETTSLQELLKCHRSERK